MPNRQLKESICTSESLALVSAEAERLFYRIIVNADDYGRYHGNPKVILAECFPLRIGDFAPKDIEAWLTELERVGMIRRYATDKRRFLHIVSWREHNTPRAKTSKYPSPDDCTHTNLQTSANICKQTHENALEVDIEVDNESEVDCLPANICMQAPTGAPTTEDSGEDDALPEMTPMEDELRQLPSWGHFSMDDRAWLESFSRDYPDTIPRDVRDMGVYWVARAEKDKKVKHSKTQWKQRLRTWSRIKAESGGGNGRHEKGGGSARALPRSYTPAPVYDRPLLRE